MREEIIETRLKHTIDLDEFQKKNGVCDKYVALLELNSYQGGVGHKVKVRIQL